MQTVSLTARVRRELGKQSKKLRASGNLPAVLYGQKKEPVSLSISASEFGHIFSQAGHSTVLDLSIEGETAQIDCLIHDVAYDPVTLAPIHVDLYRVDMNKEITTEVPLHFIGESPAVFQMEGSLLTNLETVEVEALPRDLPQSIEVDLSVLVDFEASITVADIKAPAAVKILNDPEELVAKVNPPRSIEELEALDEEVVEDVDSVESEQAPENEGKPDETTPADSEKDSDESAV